MYLLYVSRALGGNKRGLDTQGAWAIWLTWGKAGDGGTWGPSHRREHFFQLKFRFSDRPASRLTVCSGNFSMSTFFSECNVYLFFYSEWNLNKTFKHIFSSESSLPGLEIDFTIFKIMVSWILLLEIFLLFKMHDCCWKIKLYFFFFFSKSLPLIEIFSVCLRLEVAMYFTYGKINIAWCITFVGMSVTSNFVPVGRDSFHNRVFQVSKIYGSVFHVMWEGE